MEKKNCQSINNTAEEESLLLDRLIALKKQLEDDGPKFKQALHHTKENVATKNVISSKFKYRKINNNANKFISTKIDNRIFTNNQRKIKPNNLFSKTNNTSSNIHIKPNLVHSSHIKMVLNKQNMEVLDCQNTVEKNNFEINKIVKNSHIEKCNALLNDSPYKASSVSQTLLTIDKYMNNVQDYLKTSNYVVDKKDVRTLLTNNQISNSPKNVHINRQFQNQLISNNLLNSNTASSIMSIKKTTILNKKKPAKRLSGKLIESPALVKIGNTKLIRKSLFRSKWKINNKLNCFDNGTTDRKPLSTLQSPSSNSLGTSYSKTKWVKDDNSASALKTKYYNAVNANKLKWTRPNILLVNNTNKSSCPLTPKSDKLILFGKNKIIRQSLISSNQSKTKNYLLKHLSHRLALMRKLQQKNSVPKVTKSNEQLKNTSLVKKIINEPAQMKKNGRKSYSMYSYVNPTLRSKINNNLTMDKKKFSINKTPCLTTNCHRNPRYNLRLKRTDKYKIRNLNSSNSKTLEQLRSKKTLTKQLCLVFNRFGSCSKLDQGNCDKRHYKKFITLCTKFLIGKCTKESCTLSHNIIEEKVPFCKHYLNSVCVQLNCPYLHEYRNSDSPICKNFLHGYCILGKKCPKKHLNLCPIFETKNECPHGQNCLYPHGPHVQFEEKRTVDVEINEPRYFEMIVSTNGESSENEVTHIVPKRHAPLMDLPSFIPLK